MTDLSLLQEFEFRAWPDQVELRESAGPALESMGALSVSLNRNRNRTRNRNRNRNRNRAHGALQGSGTDGFDILEPWRERAALHALRDDWKDLPLALPPGLPTLRAQALDLLEKQYLLSLPQSAGRRDEILREARLELSGYLRPFGIESHGGYDATIALMLTVMALTDEIGLYYKARWNVPRPNQVEPRLRPFLAAPAHASYPSNHAFQSFSVAFIMSRVLPEHPGSGQLFLSARRIAENREWAGVHYACDTQAGHALARMLLPVLEEVLEDNMLAARAEWQ